jgi:hypothetical protein
MSFPKIPSLILKLGMDATQHGVGAREMASVKDEMLLTFKPDDWVPAQWVASKIATQYELHGIHCRHLTTTALCAVMGDGFYLREVHTEY